MPSLVAHSRLASVLSVFKVSLLPPPSELGALNVGTRTFVQAKLRTCKDNVARIRTRSSTSSDNRGSIDGERRHVQGLGYIQADVTPRRSRRMAAEAKYGNKATRNQIAQASDIMTVGGFAYDRSHADNTGVLITPCSMPRRH
ncbi:hypothetical protein OPQ81_008346 [Rhizoctonia solani]|nr:hypothetical protein OPQ81_008346 [Rhizoctonia solani]